MGHALNKSIKDFMVRSAAMRGYYTPYIPGWDNHGMPAKKKPIRRMEKALKAFSIAFRAFSELARKEGFEPSHVVWTSTPLAGEPLRPLGYFRIGRMKYIYGLKNGGESGIRTHGCSRIAGFQDFRFVRRGALFVNCPSCGKEMEPGEGTLPPAETEGRRVPAGG